MPSLQIEDEQASREGGQCKFHGSGSSAADAVAAGTAVVDEGDPGLPVQPGHHQYRRKQNQQQLSAADSLPSSASGRAVTACYGQTTAAAAAAAKATDSAMAASAASEAEPYLSPQSQAALEHLDRYCRDHCVHQPSRPMMLGENIGFKVSGSAVSAELPPSRPRNRNM